MGVPAKGQIGRPFFNNEDLFRPPDAAVFLDGKPVGRSPLSLKDIEAGSHTVVVKKEGLMPYEETVSLRDEVVTVNAKLEESGLLVVEGYPEGASVNLDGVFIDKTPLKRKNEPGKYTLKVERDGYLPYLILNNDGLNPRFPLPVEYPP